MKTPPTRADWLLLHCEDQTSTRRTTTFHFDVKFRPVKNTNSDRNNVFGNLQSFEKNSAYKVLAGLVGLQQNHHDSIETVPRQWKRHDGGQKDNETTDTELYKKTKSSGRLFK